MSSKGAILNSGSVRCEALTTLSCGRILADALLPALRIAPDFPARASSLNSLNEPAKLLRGGVAKRLARSS
ncbi:MAG: hypothetical protein KDJ20_16855, partial [Hyphomicrobiales bacterium]|nr:hypothetical protein [Hyphomicrobiales bacterium]